MRRFTFANLALWAIAVVTTVFLVPDRGVLTYLGPVYAVCAIGSTTIMRKASGSDGSRPGS